MWRALFEGQAVATGEQQGWHRQGRQLAGGWQTGHFGLVEVPSQGEIQLAHRVGIKAIARNDVEALGRGVHAVDEETCRTQGTARSRRIDELIDGDRRCRTGRGTLDIFRQHDAVVDLDIVGISGQFEVAHLIDEAAGIVVGLFRL